MTMYYLLKVINNERKIMTMTLFQGSKLTTNWLHIRLDFWSCA